MRTLPDIDVDRLVADRRELHAHPELAFEEFKTAAKIRERLEGLGYEVRTGLGQTGVAGVRRVGETGRHVLLRADMDALPVHEDNDVSYRSTVDGKMHACGHDGHVAVGLAVADRLSQVDLGGGVTLAFQPAEECGDGAEAMIDDGVMEQPAVDAAFGMHIWTYLPTGKIGVTSGPVFASVDQFEIEVVGQGGHAAVPQVAIDPVVVSAHVITALQSIVSRRRDPFEEAVLSVTSVQAGTAFNVIPETARLMGTVRTFGGEIHEKIPHLMRELVNGVAGAFGATARLHYERKIPPTVNDPEMSALMAEVAATIVGPENVLSDVRTMGGEDMAHFLEHAPGCYAFVGCANPEKSTDHPHHSPHFNIDEDALTIAAELLSRTAVEFLARPASGSAKS